MPKFLLIESSGDICSAAVSSGTEIIAEKSIQEKNSHSTYLASFVAEVMKNSGLHISDLDAVVIGGGPGSYTGLRIGASLAQGLCYAKNWSLIGIPTHKSLIDNAIQENGDVAYCAMIYAGRDEAYTTFWNGSEMSEIVPKNFTKEYMSSLDDTLCFTGDCMHLLGKRIAKERTLDNTPHARLLAKPAAAKWKKNDFEDWPYYTPLYAKDFIPGVSKKFKI